LRSGSGTFVNAHNAFAVRYGEGSDWFRVRVLGLPPHADELQFIDFERIQNARKRTVEVLEDEPLVAGFDVSGGGAAWNVIRFRRGLDARSYPAIRITGEAGRDRSVLVGRAAEVLRRGVGGTPVAALFVDSAFGAPVVERLYIASVLGALGSVHLALGHYGKGQILIAQALRIDDVVQAYRTIAFPHANRPTPYVWYTYRRTG
jgi:hypothetical protein